MGREMLSIPKGTKFKRIVSTKMRDDRGEIDDEKKTIKVNPKDGNLLNTIIHEELHRKYPKKTEEWIAKETEKREKNLSINDAINLLKPYVRKTRRGN